MAVVPVSSTPIPSSAVPESAQSLFRAEWMIPAVGSAVSFELVAERNTSIPDGDQRQAKRQSSSGSRAPARSAASDRRSMVSALRTALAVPLERLLPGVHSLLEWPSPLMPFQQDGVQALIERARMLLADDMGLGKTVQAIAAIRVLCRRRAIERTLLIAPASVIDHGAASWRAGRRSCA